MINPQFALCEASVKLRLHTCFHIRFHQHWHTVINLFTLDGLYKYTRVLTLGMLHIYLLINSREYYSRHILYCKQS